LLRCYRRFHRHLLQWFRQTAHAVGIRQRFRVVVVREMTDAIVPSGR
jgi:hypothetical protein